VLGHHVDGVVLVSTLGQTYREALRILRRSMYQVGGNLVGTVVNKMNSSHYYGSYYYKYYRYNYYHAQNGRDRELPPEEPRGSGVPASLEAPERGDDSRAGEPS
jgi:Mrp family chromosome partitioning ATPase